MFNQKFQKRDFAVEQVLQHEDIDPALMIAVYEIPACVVQFIDALHIPERFLGKTHPAAVAGYPVRRKEIEDVVHDGCARV